MALKRRRRTFSFATTTAITFLLLSSVLAINFNHPNQVSRRKEMIKEGGSGGGGGGGESTSATTTTTYKGILSRRRLIGPGSSPPTCRSKCGRCAPCRAVHVPIQPGLSIPLEYYPEAWRCKCGNKLFMP